MTSLSYRYPPHPPGIPYFYSSSQAWDEAKHELQMQHIQRYLSNKKSLNYIESHTHRGSSNSSYLPGEHRMNKTNHGDLKYCWMDTVALKEFTRGNKKQQPVNI